VGGAEPAEAQGRCTVRAPNGPRRGSNSLASRGSAVRLQQAAQALLAVDRANGPANWLGRRLARADGVRDAVRQPLVGPELVEVVAVQRRGASQALEAEQNHVVKHSARRLRPQRSMKGFALGAR